MLLLFLFDKLMVVVIVIVAVVDTRRLLYVHSRYVYLLELNVLDFFEPSSSV